MFFDVFSFRRETTKNLKNTSNSHTVEKSFGGDRSSKSATSRELTPTYAVSGKNVLSSFVVFEINDKKKEKNRTISKVFFDLKKIPEVPVNVGHAIVFESEKDDEGILMSGTDK